MPSPITDQDLYLFNEGTHFRLHEKLGAHPGTDGGREGTWFAVWAPDAESVTVIGDFNGWDKRATPMAQRAQSGVWEAFVPDVARFDRLQRVHVNRIEPGRADVSLSRHDPVAQQITSQHHGILWLCG